VSGLWVMAGITWREAVRRKILWTALAAGALMLIIFAVALKSRSWSFRADPMSRFSAIRWRPAC